MKRIMVFALILIFAVSLFAACTPEQGVEPSGSASTQPSESTSTSTEPGGDVPVPKSKTVYWCANNTANEFSVNMAKFCEEHGKSYGWDVIVLDADSDVATQVDNVEKAIAANAAAIFIDPVSTDGLNEVLLSAVNEHGIPVLTIHGSASCQDQLTAFVACDMYVGGVLEMQQCMDDIGGKGKIAIIRATEGHAVANNSTDGDYDVLEK